MHFAGPEGRAVRRGPEFPKCPEPFPWLRRLPAVTARGPTCPRAAGPSRSRTRGAAPPPAGRAPVSRAAEAAPRPARARCPAALTWPPAPTGRARPETREARPPPVAGPPARPRSPPPARARPCARRAPGAAWEAGGGLGWGGSASTRGRGARAAAAGEAGSAASVSHGARRGGRRSLRSPRSLAFSLTFPSSVSEESGRARACAWLGVCARARVWGRGRVRSPTPDVTTMATAASTPSLPASCTRPSGALGVGELTCSLSARAHASPRRAALGGNWVAWKLLLLLHAANWANPERRIEGRAHLVARLCENSPEVARKLSLSHCACLGQGGV